MRNPKTARCTRSAAWSSGRVAQCIRDGPSYWWHGYCPVIPFSMDDWPWEFLGYSAIRDGASVQDSAQQLLRAIEDSANARLRPPLAYDEDAFSKTFMERFDPRQPGQKVPFNMSMNEAMKILVPSSYYDIPVSFFTHIKDLFELIGNLLGVKDLTAIAKARQIPSADAMEKMAEMAGPLMTDLSRSMEASIRLIGEMVKGLFFQFYDAPRRVQVMGQDGMTETDYDYEPGNLVPSHMPGEPTDTEIGHISNGAGSLASPKCIFWRSRRIAFIRSLRRLANSCCFNCKRRVSLLIRGLSPRHSIFQISGVLRLEPAR